MSKAIIVCENISFNYPGENEDVLDNISLAINRGEFIGVIGANGSGKSTLAKMFNALLIPSSGNVYVEGMDTKDQSKAYDIRQKVGMVFQNPDNQIVATIVEEDVAFGPENLGFKSETIREIVDKSLLTVDMYDYKLHAPHLLSGGQKQRVAIAGVLAISPEVIILDEATAMLDPKGKKEVMSTIHKLNEEKGITIIHITHNMNEVVDADRVLVMSRGEIVLDDTPRAIFTLGKELIDYNLELPQITSLAAELKDKGVLKGSNILTIEEMVDQLCQLK
ncbi:MAG: energy-coupling factor transporter ATPase [Clostridia bacterium]